MRKTPELLWIPARILVFFCLQLDQKHVVNLWNALPNAAKATQSVNVFKSAVKNYHEVVTGPTHSCQICVSGLYPPYSFLVIHGAYYLLLYVLIFIV